MQIKQIQRQLQWYGGSMLASGTLVRRFESSQSRWIFQGEKLLSMPSFEGEVKPLVTRRRFAACNRSLQMARNSPFASKITGHFSPIVPPFPATGLLHHCRRGGSWRCKWVLPKPG
jgi:hypothetical protein